LKLLVQILILCGGRRKEFWRFRPQVKSLRWTFGISRANQSEATLMFENTYVISHY
jgi:hypothetical protein